MFHWRIARILILTLGLAGTAAWNARAQNGGTSYTFRNNYHIGFERPEAWGLKYFASASLLSGLPAPQPEHYGTGTITVGLEMDWVPQLDEGQQRIGFN